MTEGVDLTLVIRRKEGLLTISTLPRANSVKDNAQNHIVPFTVSGTPADLDQGFLSALCKPMQRAAGLLTNMAQFEQQAEKAAATSKSAKEQKEKEDKATREKREKYEKAFRKAEEQFAAKNYTEALTNYQQARLYAAEDKLKEVDEKIAAVKAAMNQGSLFDLAAQPTSGPTTDAASRPMPQPQQATPAPAPQPMPQPQLQPMPDVRQTTQPPQGMPQWQPQHQPQYQTEPNYQQVAQPVSQQAPAYMQPHYPVAGGYAHAQPAQPAPEAMLADHRPDEYEGYPDFPSDMLRQPNQLTSNF